MSPSATLALRALIRPGSRAGWREYSVVTAGDDVFAGLASAYRCYALDWRPLEPPEPAAGEELPGLVKASLQPDFNEDMPDYALVGVQDDMGTAYIWVHRSQLVLKPQESLDEMLARRVVAR